MNSYQRRQKRRRMIFGFRRFAKAAAEAGRAFQRTADAMAGMIGTFNRLKPERDA